MFLRPTTSKDPMKDYKLFWPKLFKNFYRLIPDWSCKTSQLNTNNNNNGIPCTGFGFKFSKTLCYNPGLENEFYKRVFAVNRGFYWCVYWIFVQW